MVPKCSLILLDPYVSKIMESQSSSNVPLLNEAQAKLCSSVSICGPSSETKYSPNIELIVPAHSQTDRYLLLLINIVVIYFNFFQTLYI